MRITVFGLGKIGLPLAVQFATRGHSVIGVDTRVDVVDLVSAGVEPFPGELHLAELLAMVTDSVLLSATNDAGSAVRDADAIVVAVPLYVDHDGQPDFSAIDAVTAVIGDHVRPGALISFETTLPVGTTRDRIAPEITRRSGLRVGEEVHLVFSPERVLTGRVFEDLRRYPKLVGGISEESESQGKLFYEQVLDFEERPDLMRANGVWRMGSCEAAEMAKLAETTYRDVNIALVNQFALYAEHRGLDIHTVIQACNSQPFSHLHEPGVAVGGHCIPVYPRLYLWTDPNASVVAAAREANERMPQEVVNRLAEELMGLDGRSVLILGASYRGGVKETAFSGVFSLRDALESAGAIVSVHDPLYTADELDSLGLRPHDSSSWVDAAILQAAHQEYVPWSLPWPLKTPLILDGRGVFPRREYLGSRVVTLGAP